MRTLQEIKEDVAKDVEYVKWQDLQWDYMSDGVEMELYMDRVAGRYAKEVAQDYIRWVSNQAIGGRTSTKLWADYQFELNR